MDFLVGGMPRGGTTIAAKFMSLHRDMFCYAGETHLIPFMRDLFGQFSCRPDKIEMVCSFLRGQFMTTMVEMPRFSVSRGAHPANLIFNESSVESLVGKVRDLLSSREYGESLYCQSLEALRQLLAACDSRLILGEKTPNNVFAMADYLNSNDVVPVVVVREPVGVLRSMRRRTDDYASAFAGGIESNIGIYLEYGDAIRRCTSYPDTLLVRYEEMAEEPVDVLRRMFGKFGREPEDRVLHFVERGRDQEIADRAPMMYKRLVVNSGSGELTPDEQWKIVALTRDVREAFGYTNQVMSDWGFKCPSDWPGDEVPAVVLPMSGFYASEANGHCWMKNQGRLVAYLPPGKSHTISLQFWSNFPEELLNGKEVFLTVNVGGVVREQVGVRGGPQAIDVTVNVSGDDLRPMGTKGSYVVLALGASVSYSPLAVVADATEARNLSFLLCGSKVSKSSTG